MEDYLGKEDLFKDRVCECCGNPEYLAGVASSSLGAFSILWCSICLKMQAEPKWAIDGIFEMDNWRTQYGKENFCYYDKELDSYVNYGTKEIIPIKTKDGEEYKTRKEIIEYVKKIESDRNQMSERKKT